MSKEEILNNNKLIAEFMGLIPVPSGTKTIGEIIHPEISEAFLDYNSSYNSLIPVYHRFNKLYNSEIYHNLTTEDENEFEKINEQIDDALTRTYEINIFYNELVKGVKWYNRHKLMSHE